MAIVSRCEGVYNRTGEPNVTFGERGETVERMTDFYKLKNRNERNSFRRGAPGGIRTPDLLVRSQTLYPTELRAHINNLFAARLDSI